MQLGAELKDASSMFSQVSAPVQLDVDELATGAAKVAGMFAGSNVESVGVVQLAGAADFGAMFMACPVKRVGFVRAGQAGANGGDMFKNCAQLERVVCMDLPPKCCMSGMFSGCKALKLVSWYNFDKTSALTGAMFAGSPLASLFGTDMENYKASGWTQKIPDKVKSVFGNGKTDKEAAE